MQIETFSLERIQSLHENEVEINLSDSGVHPYSLRELLTAEERERLVDAELGYGWTNGAPALREAVAALYPGRTASEVLVTNGSAEANFLLVMSLLEPGDELVLIVPNYLQIRGWARAVGVTVREVALREELGWLPDLDEVAAAITPRTRMISLCHPNNPTGRVVPEATLRGLVEIARRHGLWLHGDEVYKGSEYDGHEAPSMADLYERGIATSGLSKAMALPGLRIGWLVGPAAEMAQAWAAKDYTSITTATVSEMVAEWVLAPARRAAVLARSRAWLSANAATLATWVERHRGILSLHPPQAGGMAFLRYSLEVNSTEFVDALRNETSVLALPGDVYGLDGYLRVGIGTTPERLTEGLDRIAGFMARHYRKVA